MTNKLRGVISFEADGQKYDFRLTTNAICEYEELVGSSLIDDLVSVSDGASVRFTKIRAMMAVGVGVDEVFAGDLIDELGLDRTIQLISDGAEAAFPAASEEIPSGKRKAPPKT